MRRRLVLSLGFLLACGGPTAPPNAAKTDTADAAASGDSGAVEDIKPFEGVSVEPPDSGPPAASSTPPASTLNPNGLPSPPDECTPLAVDFEKRARPKLKACYRDGKKKDPDLKGTVKIAIDINTLGKITSIKLTEKTLPDPVAQCMLKVVKAEPFPEVSKCPGKALTIPMTFPTPQ